MSFDAQWDSAGVATNDVGVVALGASGYRIAWGDGSAERLAPDPFDDAGIVTANHAYAADGVYRVTITDRPDDPATPTVRLRAYVFAGDPDGGVHRGSAARDLFIGGRGDDGFDGGGGNDFIVGGGGDDNLAGGADEDVLFGLDGRDRLAGGDALDVIYGGDGDDVVFGEGGYDNIWGGEGRDRIDAGADGAFLDGEAGADVLIGGAGEDNFRFSEIAHTPVAAPDYVKGFDQGQDRLDVLVMFDGLFDFVGEAGFSGDGDGEVRAITGRKTTVVFGDIDGDGDADFQIVLDAPLTLTRGDFGLPEL